MQTWLQVILLGIIEGLTEFLPISSTGHLLLAEHWLGTQSDLFNVVIQSGAVLAVLAVFKNKIWHLVRDIHTQEAQTYIGQLLLAFVITSMGGLLLKHWQIKLPEEITPVAIATLLGGIALVVIENKLMRSALHTKMSWSVAAWVGLAQLVAAVFPGTSRSGITILIALCFGVARPAAAEFSFLLGIPTLLAASALQIVTNLSEPHIAWSAILLATIFAAITAFGVVTWLLRYVQHHSFAVFGWYRIVVGLWMLWLGW